MIKKGKGIKSNAKRIAKALQNGESDLGLVTIKVSQPLLKEMTENRKEMKLYCKYINEYFYNHGFTDEDGYYWYSVTDGYEKAIDGEEGELIFEVNDEYTSL